MLAVIREGLSSITPQDMKTHQESIRRQFEYRLHHLPPVEGVTPTKTPRYFTFDPGITLQQDIVGREGQVLVSGGTVMNPLKTRSLTKPLLFIDGRNDAQCGWALRQCQAHPRAKVILVAGDPFALMDTWHRPVYFDQGGQLTGKLGIRHVPARVTQGEMVLAIEEVLDNEGL